MKKHLALALFLSFALLLTAQLPQGTLAPDFSAQDINGQNWHLYELLDQGKIVVLEVSATWCQPCWAYHNSHAMQQLYEAHGPAGDDKLQVLFVEGDPATNLNCLYGQPGCNSFSPGNWINGTTYPYLDNPAIADSFQVAYFPTIYLICPNKKAYQVGQLNAEDLWQKALGCPVASGTNNAGIFDYDAGTELREICEGLKIMPSFSLINLGSEPLTSASFNLQWNNNVEQTKQWTGYLPTYGEATISFDSLSLDGSGNLKTTLTSVNNLSGDDDFSNNVRNNEFSIASEFDIPQIILKIRTDDYGAETYWEVRDELGNVLYKGGNLNVGPDGGGGFGNTLPGPGAYANNVVINKSLNLPGDGCYSIFFVDAYGDGMCCEYGNGYYKLYNGNNPAVPILTGGEFEATEHRGFEVKSTTAVFSPDDAVANLRLFPNPAVDQLNIEFDLVQSSIVAFTCFNALGQTVYHLAPQQLSFSEHRWTTSVNDWPAGVYFIRFQVGDQAVMKKIRVGE